MALGAIVLSALVLGLDTTILVTAALPTLSTEEVLGVCAGVMIVTALSIATFAPERAQAAVREASPAEVLEPVQAAAGRT